MDLIWEGIKEAIILLFQGDKEVFSVVTTSLRVSLNAILICLLLGCTAWNFLRAGPISWPARGR